MLFYHNLHVQVTSQSIVSRPAALIPPGNLLEMQILLSSFRPNESETLWMSQKPVF